MDSCFTSFNSWEEFISRSDAFLARKGSKFVHRAFEHKTRVIHKYACKPVLFRTRWEDGRHGGEREDLWFPCGTWSSIVDYAHDGKGEAKGGDKINRHFARRIIVRACSIDFMLNKNSSCLKRREHRYNSIKTTKISSKWSLRKILYSQNIIFLIQQNVYIRAAILYEKNILFRNIIL